MISAILIGIQTDMVAMNPSTPAPLIFEVVAYLFSVVFFTEWLCRVYCSGCRPYFFGPTHLFWNWADTAFVIASVVEVLFDIFLSAATSSASQVRIVRILRITRFVKAVRVVRIIRFIRVLRSMVNQLLSTMKALVWAIFLLVMIIYVFAIVFTQASVAQRQAEGSEDLFTGGGSDNLGGDGVDPLGSDLDVVAPTIQSWATVPRSMLSLLMAASSGISWIELIAPLSDYGWIYVALFVLYVTFVHLAVLNVVTGVFCQTAIENAQQDLELNAQAAAEQKKALITRITAVFEQIDTDRSGSITVQEFTIRMEDETVRNAIESLGLNVSDAWHAFELLDTGEGDDLVDLDEFTDGILRLIGNARSLDLAQVQLQQKRLANKFANFLKKYDSLHDRLSKATTAESTPPEA